MLLHPPTPPHWSAPSIIPRHHIGLLPPSSHATTSYDAQYLGCLTTCRVSLAARLSTPPLCLPLVVAFDCYLDTCSSTHARARARATIIGVPSDPKQFAKWNPQQFDDEPNLKEFKRGTISYAGAGVNSRSCHLFIAFGPGQCQLAPHLFGSTREMQPPPFPPDGGGAAHQCPLESVASSTSATLC